MGIGCGAQTVQNCLQIAVDTLPVKTEAPEVKIFRYFYIYRVRVAQLK
jgi:hypothetical protein